MILRIPDYYMEFSCIADKCKDSCCIGWEINIDEDTHAYYSSVQGTFGERLKADMYLAEDGEYSFRLKEHGRCPFLNHTNLCEICIELGEEALSEVCTEYPRFTLDYGNVFQKCLSLSCEEAGRLIFERTAPVRFVEQLLPGEDMEDENAAWYHFLEEAQTRLIAILQDRSKTIWEREAEYLAYARRLQNVIVEQEDLSNGKVLVMPEFSWQSSGNNKIIDSYEEFSQRFAIFEQMDVLNDEWVDVKKQMRTLMTEGSYEHRMEEWLASGECLERDYEQLFVYFTFRYFMRTVYDYNLLAKAKMVSTFTRVIRDMDAVRFAKNRGFCRADRVDTARIFSKEVEHSEENVQFAEEELEFSGDI